MSNNNSGYDRALLDEAPEVMPQQRQRFYDADLLNDGQRTDGSPAGAGAAVYPTAARSNTDLEAGHGASVSKEYTPLPPHANPKTPWYKTRKGKIGLVALVIVIIGAIIGGVVGGVVGSDDDDNNNNGNGSAGTTSSESELPASISPTSSASAGQPAGSGPVSSTSAGAEAAPFATGTISVNPGQQGASGAVAIAFGSVQTGV